MITTVRQPRSNGKVDFLEEERYRSGRGVFEVFFKAVCVKFTKCLAFQFLNTRPDCNKIIVLISYL